MWTADNRPRYNRDKLRYPSDLTDEEWVLVAPLIPPAKRGGRRRSVNVREVVNGGSSSTLVHAENRHRQHPSAQEINACPAIHCPLQSFQPIDLPLCPDLCSRVW